MRARRIAGIAADERLDAGLRRIVAVRLAELRSFAPRALDPDEREAQHDMRIAAKRLRYVLELGSSALGSDAAAGAKLARSIQDALGEVRDLDELIARLRGASSPPALAIARLATRRAELFERFAREWSAADLSPIERSLRAPRAGGAA